MRPYRLTIRKPLSDFIESRAVDDIAQLAEQVVREGDTFESLARLELAMQARRYIPDLNRDWHAMSMLACGTQVNLGGDQGEDAAGAA
jgi:hypothetical protein